MAMSPGTPAIVVAWRSPAGCTLDGAVVVDTACTGTCAIAVPVASTRTEAVATSARVAPTALAQTLSARLGFIPR
jgi:hypothetical protein